MTSAVAASLCRGASDINNERHSDGVPWLQHYFGICGFVPHLLGSGPMLKVTIPPALTALYGRNGLSIFFPFSATDLWRDDNDDDDDADAGGEDDVIADAVTVIARSRFVLAAARR
jgi:hypothetical protein